MKNKLLALLILITISFFLEVKAQVRYGVIGAVDITNITDVNRESKSRTGFQIGGLALIPLDDNDQFYLQPELLYSSQGEYYLTGGKEYKVFLNYINLPILAKAYLSESNNEFFAEAGPHIGYLISENVERYENPNMKFKKLDIAAALGFGYSFNREFELFGRYTFGLFDVIDGDSIDSVNHTSILSFGLKYIFY